MPNILPFKSLSFFSMKETHRCQYFTLQRSESKFPLCSSGYVCSETVGNIRRLSSRKTKIYIYIHNIYIYIYVYICIYIYILQFQALWALLKRGQKTMFLLTTTESSEHQFAWISVNISELSGSHDAQWLFQILGSLSTEACSKNLLLSNEFLGYLKTHDYLRTTSSYIWSISFPLKLLWKMSLHKCLCLPKPRNSRGVMDHPPWWPPPRPPGYGESSAGVMVYTSLNTWRIIIHTE